MARQVDVPHIKEDLQDSRPNHHLVAEPIQIHQLKTIQKHRLKPVLMNRKLKVVRSDYEKNVRLTLRNGVIPYVCFTRSSYAAWKIPEVRCRT